MFSVFAGAGLVLVAMMATAITTAIHTPLGTEKDLKLAKYTSQKIPSIYDNYRFSLSDLLDPQDEATDPPTEQDVEQAMRILEEEGGNTEEEDEAGMDTVAGPSGVAESQAASDAEVAAAAEAAAALKLKLAAQAAATAASTAAASTAAASSSAAAATAAAAAAKLRARLEMEKFSSQRDRLSSTSTGTSCSTNFSKTESEMPPLDDTS